MAQAGVLYLYLCNPCLFCYVLGLLCIIYACAIFLCSNLSNKNDEIYIFLCFQYQVDITLNEPSQVAVIIEGAVTGADYQACVIGFDDTDMAPGLCPQGILTRKLFYSHCYKSSTF